MGRRIRWLGVFMVVCLGLVVAQLVNREVADRIGVINHGQILFMGTIPELRKRVAHDGTLEDLFLRITEEEEEGAP